jgi:hypothetical protein
MKRNGLSTVGVIMLIGLAMIAIGLVWFIISSIILKQEASGNEINQNLDNRNGILNGTVEDIWPENVGIYFGSSDLPTNRSYEGYYIDFPESKETDCLLIARYMFPVVGYDKCNIGFNFETSIERGDRYNVWETLEKCQNYSF